jgi:hypothetical protein
VKQLELACCPQRRQLCVICLGAIVGQRHGCARGGRGRRDPFSASAYLVLPPSKEWVGSGGGPSPGLNLLAAGRAGLGDAARVLDTGTHLVGHPNHARRLQGQQLGKGFAIAGQVVGKDRRICVRTSDLLKEALCALFRLATPTQWVCLPFRMLTASRATSR